MARRGREEAAAAPGRDGKRRRTEEAKEAEIALDVWSLRAAQAFAGQVRGAAVVSIRAVKVQEAAGMLVLLHRQEISKGWRLRTSHSRRLEAVVHLDALLAVGIDAHLPIIVQNTFVPIYLCELRDWTWELQTAARGVNRDVFEGVRNAGNKVRRFVRRAFVLVRKSKRKANPAADRAALRADDSSADPSARSAADLAVRNAATPEELGAIYARIYAVISRGMKITVLKMSKCQNHRAHSV